MKSLENDNSLAYPMIIDNDNDNFYFLHRYNITITSIFIFFIYYKLGPVP